MLMAFVWWAFLLFKKNDEVFVAKSKQLYFEMKETGSISHWPAFEKKAAFLQLYQKHERQKWMILGEVSVFSVTLLIGLILIHRAYRKQMELALQQRNFLLSITHELKSPISSIKLVLETFIKRNLTSEQLQKLAGGALSETNRLNELVSDLLLSARLERAYKPVFENLDWDEFLKKVTSDFSSSHPEGDLVLTIEHKLPETQADPQGLEIIFINLFENALKYNFEIEKKIRVNAFTKNGQVCVEVADNGCGIAEPERKKVFQKFYRIGSEDTRKTKGTGLGLFIVREIVKAHKGSISVSGNQPQGTIFRLCFPV